MHCCSYSLLISNSSASLVLLPPTFSNLNSLPKPRPIPKPTWKKNRKSIAFNPLPGTPDCRIGSDDGEHKWVFSKTENHPEGVCSSSSTAQEMYAQMLRQFVESKKLDEARDLYFVMKDNELEPGIVLETALIDLFMKSGEVSDAFHVFESMNTRNVVTWTSLIFGCIRNGHQEIGFSLFVEMLESGVLPNDFTFNIILQACADLAVLDVGEQVHSLVVTAGLNGDCRIGNCLINFYSKCRLIDEAQKVFVRMLNPDLVSFTSMISGFCKNGLFKLATRLFYQMRWIGLQPNEHTVTTILAMCDHAALGEQIHAYMIKTSLHQSLYSASSLIEFYSKNNLVDGAELVFGKLESRNVVTWSTMMSCYVRNGLANKAMELFCRMAYSGVQPNEFTFATAVGACGLCSDSISLGQQLHCWIIKMHLGMENRIFNALLTMYARNSKVAELAEVFEKIQDLDIVSWCATISGYYQNGFSEKSISLLCLMHRNGGKPNEYGFSSSLSSCATLALLHQGKQFHAFALKLGCDFDVCVGNALINMYAKCGDIDAARLAFHVMPSHDVMSWNTLIHGYAHHGHARKAIQVFNEMVESDCILPDHATFVGLLSACSHVGFVEEAFGYLDIMGSQYGIAPSLSHYACIIDMMGRAGKLDEAHQIMCKMPFEPDSLIWKTLLGSCRVHKYLELGTLAAEKATELSPQDAANYVLLSNLNATCEKWEDAERLRNVMEERGVKKDSGCSWIEIQNQVHSFISRDTSHPKGYAIYRELELLVLHMKEEGYCPDLSFAFHDS